MNDQLEYLETHIVEFKCRMCGRYYEAQAKLCMLDRQRIGDFEALLYERRCPNCGYMNKEIDSDLKTRRYSL